MRTLGCVLLAAGIGGYLWAGEQLALQNPVPEDATLEQHLEHPAGRLEIARYVAAGSAALGLLLVFFPRGR